MYALQDLGGRRIRSGKGRGNDPRYDTPTSFPLPFNTTGCSFMYYGFSKSLPVSALRRKRRLIYFAGYVHCTYIYICTCMYMCT